MAKQPKFPIWIKTKGKWELIPYHLMTTFSDGTKGFHWPQIRRDPAAVKFVSEHKRYFRVKRIKVYAPPPRQRHVADTDYRIILASRRSLKLPKWCFRLGLGLNIGCNLLDLVNIFIKSPYWDVSYGLVGITLGIFLTFGFMATDLYNDDYILRGPSK